jgi:CheY-like chemotaxis protein
VLVVDDEADVRQLVHAILDECGSFVRTASSAEEALDVLSRETADVLISDVGMPGTDGYELVRRLRALPADRGGEIPAIALTAYTRVEDRQRAEDAGFSLHVSKPVEPAELVTIVGSVARRPSAS